MIVPVQKDDDLLLDVGAADVRDGHVRLWWLGQSGFLVQFDGAHLLLDPYLSDSLTAKYANTDKPHVRMTERVIDPARLDFIDVVTSSHNHTDHLDAETLGPLRHANPGMALVIAEVNRGFVASRLQIDPDVPVGLAIGAHVDVGPFRIEAVPAAHEALDPQYVGYVVRCGAWTLYHSGDTVRFEGMADVLRPHAIDVALLPINGRAPERARRRATSTPPRRRRSRTTSARAWPSPATTRCSRSTRQTPRRSSRPAVPSVSAPTSCAAASSGPAARSERRRTASNATVGRLSERRPTPHAGCRGSQQSAFAAGWRVRGATDPRDTTRRSGRDGAPTTSRTPGRPRHGPSAPGPGTCTRR